MPASEWSPMETSTNWAWHQNLKCKAIHVRKWRCNWVDSTSHRRFNRSKHQAALEQKSYWKCKTGWNLETFCSNQIVGDTIDLKQYGDC